MLRVLPIFLLALFCSCEQVIEVDLNESDPQLTVEAQLTAGEQDFRVRITTTGNYFGTEGPRPVDEAIVVLRDESTATDLDVPAIGEGEYVTFMRGEIGHTYTLTVELDGIVYRAQATIPARIALQELELDFREATPFFEEGYLVYSRFNDPEGTPNYYRFIHTLNDSLQAAADDFQVVDDNLFDGGLARVPIVRRTFAAGSSVEARLWHLDQAAYDYYNSLTDIIGDGQGANAGSAAPGNPVGNWDGNVLGIFAAYTADSLRIDLPE